MWWCWRAYSDGHVRSHNSGSQHWNSYFLTLVDLTLILFTIYSDFTQSFTLNDYQVDGGIGTEIGNWTTMELDRTEVLDTVAW